MTPVSTCPKCGAPIYMPTGGNGTQLPMAQHTCMCRFNTNPVKELTDEEILKLEEIEFENYCVDKESRGRKTATITDPEWAIWFAKAILRKAQDK